MYHVVKDEAGNTKIMTDEEYQEHQNWSFFAALVLGFFTLVGSLIFASGERLHKKGGINLLGNVVLYLIGVGLIVIGCVNGTFMSGMSPLFMAVVVGFPSIFLWVLIWQRADLGLIVQALSLVFIVRGLVGI